MEPQAPTTQPPSEPQPKLSKKQLTLFVSLGVAGLLAIIAMVIYVVFFSVTKQDYRHASVQTNAVVQAYNRLSVATSKLSFNASNSKIGDAAFDKSSAEYYTAYDNYQIEVGKLYDEPALQNGEVQVAYQLFIEKHSDFTLDLDTTMTAAPDVRKATVACSAGGAKDVDTSDLAKIVSAYDKVMTPCKQAMENLTHLEGKEAREVGQKAVDYIAKIRSQLVTMQASYIAGNRTAFESQYNTFLELVDDSPSYITTLPILQQKAIATPEKELNNLAAIIAARQ